MVTIHTTTIEMLTPPWARAETLSVKARSEAGGESVTASASASVNVGGMLRDEYVFVSKRERERGGFITVTRRVGM